MNNTDRTLFFAVLISAVFLYCYTLGVGYPFLTDNSITLLSYLVGLTALIAFTITFSNSFASTDVKNAYYLGINRNLFRLHKKPGYSLISSKMFQIGLFSLYVIPIFLELDKHVPSKAQSIINNNINNVIQSIINIINSLLLSFWYVTYLSCLFCLILAVCNCLSLLWSRSDMLQSERRKTDDMINDYYKEEFNERFVSYLKTQKNYEDYDPINLIKYRIKSFQEDEKYTYLHMVLGSEKIATLIYKTLFMDEDGQKIYESKTNAELSSIVDSISHINHYLKNKWEFLSNLEMEKQPQDLLDFIYLQCKKDTELCLNVCASWEKEYSKKVWDKEEYHPMIEPVCESGEIHFLKRQVGQKQQIDTLLYKMAQCYIKVYLHSDTYPEKIITLHETLNNTIDIGRNIQTATQKVKGVLSETQNAIESDYLETAYEFLRTYPWQTRGWQVWKVKKDYIKSISEFNKNKTETKLLYFLNRQIITDSVLLVAILEFLPIEQTIRHLIYTCVDSRNDYDKYGKSPIVVSYKLYDDIIRDKGKRLELDELRKSPDSRASLIESISKDIDEYFGIDSPFEHVPVNKIISSIFSDEEDKKIDQQLIDEMSKSFGAVNYLALRSCLTSEYDVVQKISPDIAESPQKEDLRDSIKSTQKNYPKTIPSVMARLSEILQK